MGPFLDVFLEVKINHFDFDDGSDDIGGDADSSSDQAYDIALLQARSGPSWGGLALKIFQAKS